MKPNPNVLAFLKSLFFTYILTGILLFVLAFLFYKMKMPQSQLRIGIYAIYIISCLTGGFIIGKTMQHRKFLWGMAFGILYFLILMLLSFIIQKEIVQGIASSILIMAICAVCGMVGGMIS
ncbi:MAG: TIGR04086 family membrane protein [Lachnospiraceae bacterium]|nr:TIGR04086 family membrane protein [Candidatus Fimimorpha excrementavium]